MNVATRAGMTGSTAGTRLVRRLARVLALPGHARMPVQRAPRRGLSVGMLVVLPFVLLSLLLGVVTSAVVSQELGASAATRLAALATREEDAVNGSFQAFEQRQVTDLRLMGGTQGVPHALGKGNAAQLRDLLYPAVATQLPNPLEVSAITTDGRDLLTLRVDAARPDRCLCSAGRDMRAWPHVADVLAGSADAQGPKYAGIYDQPGGAVMYIVGPVAEGGQPRGAMVVVEPLSGLLQAIHEESGFPIGIYRPDGQLLAATSDLAMGAGALAAPERAAVTSAGPSPATAHHPLNQFAGAPEVFFVPLQIRGIAAGYAAVVVPATVVGEAQGRLPWLLIAIFGGGLLLTLLTGAWVSRRLTRPLGRLLEATDRVAAGDLTHRAPVSSANELGRLSQHFNAMTAVLEEKTEQLEANTEETVRALAAAIDARDAYTHGHSVRVARYSEALAQEARLPARLIETLHRGCLIHDIGKIGVPDRILSKRGRLTRTEAAEMRTHPVLGHRMLQHLRWYADVLEVVLHHHERWDGLGYPDRLAGDEIPLLARLTSIADTLDAMTSHRPYREAFPFDRAAAEIDAGAGSQFDPAMVAVFNRCRERLRALVESEFSVAGPAEMTVQEAVELVS